MVWTFGAYRLDPERHELWLGDEPVHVEPQVFSVIRYLLEHRDRMVDKDELVKAVWAGSAVSDASISSRIRSARAALGDDGVSQSVIRTVHGRGFRFVAAVDWRSTAASMAAPPAPRPTDRGRPSIAILPFRLLSAEDSLAFLAEAIPHEIILALSRLRWIAVTARGSSFRLREVEADLGHVAATLGVRYVLTGVLEVRGRNASVTVELTDADRGQVIWADRISAPQDELEAMRNRLVVAIVGALELRIPLNEADLAQARGSAEFDAWAQYHIGLRHLYRFTPADNAIAKAHFTKAATLDPAFARAEAGLSFTHFIDAFLRIVPDVAAASTAARRHAERGLELDALDPFVNFTMGRAHWLVNDAEGARPWLARAIDINPNYAQGLYASAFTSMLIGDSSRCEAEVQAALKLSPIDPLLYGMYGVRAQMLIQKGDHAAASEWGEKAASTPGAHHLIAMIAAVSCKLAGADARATRWADVARSKRANVTAQDYASAFPIRNTPVSATITDTLRKLGF